MENEPEASLRISYKLNYNTWIDQGSTNGNDYPSTTINNIKNYSIELINYNLENGIEIGIPGEPPPWGNILTTNNLDNPLVKFNYSFSSSCPPNTNNNKQSICPNIKVKGKTTLAYIDKNKVKTPTRADLECVDASEFIQGSQKGKCPTIRIKGGIRYGHRMKVKTPTKAELNCE